MVLQRRLMWPSKGENITVFQNNRVMMEGYVLYAGDDVISVLGKNGHAASISAQELLRGIENRSIVVKKN